MDWPRDESHRMNLTESTSLDRLVEEHPLAARVFARYGIDFCCGGDRPLSSACKIAGAKPDEVIAALRDELERSSLPIEHWRRASVDDLLDHILVHYHAPLSTELPRLEALARRLTLLHRDQDVERLDALLRTVRELRAELENHLPREEGVLFPALRSGDSSALAPHEANQAEERAVGALLEQLRELTDDFTVPEPGCNSRRALYAGLAALHHETQQHIRLEHEVLPGRVLAN